jgi:hypothetical protein
VSALDRLIDRWREHAATLQAYGATAVAQAVERCCQDLENVRHEDGSVLLSLNEAARLSGYAPDTLGRMIRDGRLENHGRRNAPRVRLADLPLRVGHSPVGSTARHRPTVKRDGDVHDTIDHQDAA